MTDDIFGFDDLSAAFKKIESKYPDKAEALLMAQGRVANNRVKSKSPVGKTKKLRGSWRLKKAKKYGKALVARVQSEASHGHLVELGHEIVRGGRTRKNNRSLNRVQRSAKGIKGGSRVEGKKMLEATFKELDSIFEKAAEKMLDELTKEVEI